MKLWHCEHARSLRPLWLLEELDVPYELQVMAFPPRYKHKEFLTINVLGTVPYFEDGATRMTESSGICLYLINKYRRFDLGLETQHPEYGAYLNWLFQSDATLTFPQTIYLRYTRLEPDERRSPQVADDYRRWYLGRLKMLSDHLSQHDYLCENRFTIADIAVSYALYFGVILKIHTEYPPQINDYLARTTERPAFKRALSYQ